MNSRFFAGLVSTALISGCVGDAAIGPPTPDSGTDTAVVVDSGTDAPSPPADGGGDAPAGPWTPKKLPALAMWLDGSLGVTAGGGSKVSKWADQSGNANDAIQQNATYQPMLSGKVNNRDCVYFTQTGTPVELKVPSPQNAKMSGDFTVMLVFQTDLPTSNAADLFRSEATGTTHTELTVSPPDLMASFTVSGSGKAAFAPQAIFNDKKPHVVGMRKSATKLEVLADGANASVLNPPVGDVSGQLTIGSQIKGSICEVVLSTGTVDDTALGELTSYLKKKYAL